MFGGFCRGFETNATKQSAQCESFIIYGSVTVWAYDDLWARHQLKRNWKIEDEKFDKIEMYVAFRTVGDPVEECRIHTHVQKWFVHFTYGSSECQSAQWILHTSLNHSNFVYFFSVAGKWTIGSRSHCKSWPCSARTNANESKCSTQSATVGQRTRPVARRFSKGVRNQFGNIQTNRSRREWPWPKHGCRSWSEFNSILKFLMLRQI